MNDVNLFIKKILDWIEHIVGFFASIMGILCFFGIDSNKIKPYILLISRKIIYICKYIKNILYKKFLNIKIFFMHRQMALLFIFVFLVNILFFVPVVYTKKESKKDLFLVLNKSEYDAIFSTANIEYFEPNNINDQSFERMIEQIVKDNFKMEQIKELYNLIFYFNTDENYLVETIKNEFDMLRNSCKENTTLNNEISSDAYFYSEIEADLFNNSNETISFDLLDKIIEGRKELFERCPNKTFSWLLANSYQAYAYNYSMQTSESDEILHYYIQSIYYAKKSLEFEMDSEEKEKRIKYIQMRYKDIANCNIFDDEVRYRAYEVYCVIEDILNDNSFAINFEDNKLDSINQFVAASYDMNNIQNSSSGNDVIIVAETSFPADNVTISAMSDENEV